MKITYSLISALLWSALATNGLLVVTVSAPKVAGQKVVVPLAMKNSLDTKIESARAVVFLLDLDDKLVGQGTRWVIGGGKDKSGLAAGATNTFHFVITTDKPISTTNLSAKVSFSRVVIEGGKMADVGKDVQIQQEGK